MSPEKKKQVRLTCEHAAAQVHPLFELYGWKWVTSAGAAVPTVEEIADAYERHATTVMTREAVACESGRLIVWHDDDEYTGIARFGLDVGYEVMP